MFAIGRLRSGERGVKEKELEKKLGFQPMNDKLIFIYGYRHKRKKSENRWKIIHSPS